jgi:hypothetical protein
MTVVTGVLRHPVTGEVADDEYISFELVTSDGERVREAYVGTETIVRRSQIRLSTTGYYAATLPASASISPDGTRWRRTFHAGGDTVSQQLIVPVSGTSAETDILAEPLDAVAPEVLTSLVDQVSFTSATTVALNFTQLVPIPNSSVTVPNMSQTAEIRAHGPLRATFVGQMALVIGPASSTALGTQLDTAWVVSSQTNAPYSMDAVAWVPPNTPGDYQLYVYGASGTIAWDCSAFTVGTLTVYAV